MQTALKSILTLGVEYRIELSVAIPLKNGHTEKISPLHSKSENALDLCIGRFSEAMI
jgi:hypothetical protein